MQHSFTAFCAACMAGMVGLPKLPVGVGLPRLPVCIGTDCTGIASVLIAMSYLGVPYRHVFASEIEPSARQQVQECFGAEHFTHNIFFRSLASAPLADLYVVGFPCQPFSQAGLENGFDARGGNGVIFFAVLHYIKNKQPRAFILENVVGIEWICAGSCFETVLRELYSLASYNIYWQMMDTQNHGIPHSRPRYYFIGILKRWDRGTFTFPEPCRSRPLESFLENQVRRPTPLDLPPENQKVARANVIAFLEKMQAKGHDVLSETWTLDCDSSLYRAGAMHGVCCCLTRSRPLGHWISNRGRRLTLLEHMRLQGISDDFPIFIGEMEFRQHLGNSMSVNVLERLLVSLLPAAGLWDTSLLRDRYADSTTVA